MNPENPACPVAPADGTGVNPVRNISLAEKTIEDVLLHFGNTFKIARRRYRQFVEKGIKHGRRTDLQGGGLVRPACHARPENICKEQLIGTVQGMVEEANGR